MADLYEFPPEAGPVIPTPNETEVHSTSAPGRCTGSPDTCHHWVRVGWGVQSIEYFKCKYCPETISD